MVGAGWLGIYDPDGTELFKTNAGTGQPGPPCVADFDGDDVAEIAWASSSQFNMFELDGTLLWTQTITDASGLAGCSGYDVNGDGAYEVLFADENTFGFSMDRREPFYFHSSDTLREPSLNTPSLLISTMTILQRF